ncbi:MULTISPECIES: PepSY-associated TM helix domain-containing protein [Paenibacillus]|uniref:PepSY-associated TM helix domain-containing protein n=1 Tax=Paenibacillus TaxID=44249 RepID=UPI00020D7BDE|nr:MULTISPECIES: PepSY-associated TM helix domain-containing protein [Paenibacillus]EGL17833.1 PepSY domain protein [Paenibacillus sp. HGF7]EPD81579.1 hypothetical protein HMPREF1207_05337 [Paenibacillus sp. HGH0039]MBV6715349.1 PepSY domain-containing protein [Paenibacillus chitinolyticus]
MKTRKYHLWVGLIASIFIFVEALTGILLVHTSTMGFNKQVQTYEAPAASNSGQQTLNVAEAVLKASQSGAFDLSEARLVMNHTLGDGHHGQAGDYKVRLRDDDQTLYVIDLYGNVIRKEVNATNNFVRDLHFGELYGKDITWFVDIAAISIMFLTATGIVLSIRVLKAGSIRKSKRKKAEAAG